MANNLTGAKLADHLAKVLTNLEFELLVRKRISSALAYVHATRPNLSESHDKVFFFYNNSDSSYWDCGLGETYSKNATTKGEVLSHTLRDVGAIMDAKECNKLSLLLAPPISQAGLMFDDAPVSY
jgi:hypothetical protein